MEDVISSPIRVFSRLRPINSIEVADNQRFYWKCSENKLMEETQTGHKGYSFDKCFPSEDTNRNIYSRIGKQMILKVMEGYHSTLMTYGQNGTGKSHTMKGTDEDPGFVFLSIRDIFDYIESHPSYRFTIKLSCYEIFNEMIIDLLGNNQQLNLRIVNEDPIKGIVISSLSEIVIKTRNEFIELIRKSFRNKSSNVSHVIYRINITSIGQNTIRRSFSDESSSTQEVMVPGMIKSSYLTFVDLADSSVLPDNSQKSLTALSNVVNILSENMKHKDRPQIVPYRDSVLTRALKQSLGGNSITGIICTIAPTRSHRDITLATIQFGQLCQTIVNSVHKNMLLDDPIRIKQSESIIIQLRKQLSAYESKNSTRNLNILNGETDVEQLMREKVQLEDRLHELQQLFTATNTSTSTSATSTTNPAMESLLASWNESKVTISQLQIEISYLQHRISILQEEYQDIRSLDELKADWNEYEKEMEALYTQTRNQLEKEKILIKSEKEKILAERTQFEEKETRLGTLLAELDERESKLLQHQSILKEEKSHWQQAIIDLTKREELIKEWQDNYKHREKKLKDLNEHQEKKFHELTQKEYQLSEKEQQLLLQEKILIHKENQLQVQIQEYEEWEKTQQQMEVKFVQQEQALLVAQENAENHEKELLIKRKELENYENILKEQEKKYQNRMKIFEEREEEHERKEKEFLKSYQDYESQWTELRQKQQNIQLIEKKNEIWCKILKKKEILLIKNTENYHQEVNSFKRRELDLNIKENEIKELEKKYENMKFKEENLNQKILEMNRYVENQLQQEMESLLLHQTHEMKELLEIFQQQLQGIFENYEKFLKIKNQLKIPEIILEEKEEGESGREGDGRGGGGGGKKYSQLLDERNDFYDQVRDEIVQNDIERVELDEKLMEEMKFLNQMGLKNKHKSNAGSVELNQEYLSIHRTLVAQISDFQKKLNEMISIPIFCSSDNHPEIEVLSQPIPTMESEYEKHRNSLKTSREELLSLENSQILLEASRLSHSERPVSSEKNLNSKLGIPPSRDESKQSSASSGPPSGSATLKIRPDIVKDLSRITIPPSAPSVAVSSPSLYSSSAPSSSLLRSHQTPVADSINKIPSTDDRHRMQSVDSPTARLQRISEKNSPASLARSGNENQSKGTQAATPTPPTRPGRMPQPSYSTTINYKS